MPKSTATCNSILALILNSSAFSAAATRDAEADADPTDDDRIAA